MQGYAWLYLIAGPINYIIYAYMSIYGFSLFADEWATLTHLLICLGLGPHWEGFHGHQLQLEVRILRCSAWKARPSRRSSSPNLLPVQARSLSLLKAPFHRIHQPQVGRKVPASCSALPATLGSSRAASDYAMNSGVSAAPGRLKAMSEHILSRHPKSWQPRNSVVHFQYHWTGSRLYKSY